jgi:hypothetical protein
MVIPRLAQYSRKLWTSPRLLLWTVLLAVLGSGLVIAPRETSPPAPQPTPPAVPPPSRPHPPVPVPFQNTRSARTPQVVRTWELVGGVGVNLVTVNIEASNVRMLVGFAPDADPVHGYFPFENFYRIVAHYKPRAAINGTYFHLLNGQPTGSIVRHGKFLYDGRWGTTICMDVHGRVTCRYRSGTYGRKMDWSGVYNAITTGPTLVREGKVYLHATAEGFRDPHVLGVASRSAIGLTWEKKLLLVTVPTPIDLNKLANIMLHYSCKDAANLDGGSSTALYCNGEFVTKPRRKLSNVLLVYD